MSSNRPSNRPRNKPPEPWRIERMVQRVPAHIGEENSFSPWLVVGAVGVIALVAGLLVFLGGLPNIGVSPVVPTAVTRTRTPHPTNVVVVTATPEANTATPTARPTPYMVQYTVKSGDVLINIANQFNVTVEQIQDANNLNGDIIHVGDKLLIPQPTPTPKPGAIAENTAAPPTPTGTATVPASAFNTPTLLPTSNLTTAQGTTPTPTAGVVVYYIQSGDNLGTISKAFSTTVDAIMSVNKMTNTILRVGQAITIPVGAWTPTWTPTRNIERTVTPTPQYTYNAPALLSPGANAQVQDSVIFQWTAVGVLPDSASYIVSLRYDDGDNQVTKAFDAGRATSYRLDASPSGKPNTGYSWYVVVVRSIGCGPASPDATQPCAVSPPSGVRTFIWK